MEIDCGFTREGHWFRYRAAAIIIENDHVLFAWNPRDRYYYSVGGGVHAGESSAEAVLREVKEETGVAYEIDRPVFFHENFFPGSITLEGLQCHEICVYYLMKSRGTMALDSHSTTQDGVPESMHWIPIDKLGEVTAYPSFLQERIRNLPQQMEPIVTRE